jgi:hypothetical protein
MTGNIATRVGLPTVGHALSHLACELLAFTAEEKA